MRLASSTTPGASARTCASSRGSRVIWLASVMQIEKRRCAVDGSNGAAACASRCRPASTSRTVPIKASARGVGSMPSAVRTNRGSPSSLRSRASQMLTVGWLWPSASAERVTLRVM